MKVKTIELTNEELTEAAAKACNKIVNDLLEDCENDPRMVFHDTLIIAAFTALLKEMLFTED